MEKINCEENQLYGIFFEFGVVVEFVDI